MGFNSGFKGLKSKGPKTDPCGSPERTNKGNENGSKIRTEDS